MLHKNQEVCDILLEAVSEGILIVDSHQLINEVNTKAESMFGYNKGELLQKELKDLIPTEFQNKYMTYFEAAIHNGKKRQIGKLTDIYGKKQNGDHLIVQLELKPFSLHNENYLLVLIEDVSKKRDIENNLMLKSTALEYAGNGIVITDALKHDNPIIYFNPAFQKLTGYNSEEILGYNCRFLQGEDSDQRQFKILRDAIKNGESCNVTVRNYRKDGTLFWNDLYIMPIINSDGLLTNFIGIQNDVTLRVEAESERNHFASIFRESLNEIYVFDAKTLKFLNVNHGAQKNIGYTLKEMLDMTPLDLKKELNEYDFRNRLDALKLNNVDKIEIETRHQRKDGTTYPIEEHLQLSSLNNKDVFVSIILDITQRKNYTEQLEKKVQERTAQLKIALSKEKELNELKTQFLSLVAHEFKTPLSGILTSSVLLSKYKLEEEQQKRNKHIKIIGEKVYYLNTIINEFLSLENLEAGKVTYNYHHFKLSKVIDEVIYNANMLLKEGQKISYPENITEISLYQDEKIIGLILTNILNNAIKYSQERTTVSIAVMQAEEEIIIQVADQGIGIPLKDQKSIFERYFRADNVINIHGTGIGLNIVQSHLENLGGTVSFESEENVGTTFTLTIPNTLER